MRGIKITTIHLLLLRSKTYSHRIFKIWLRLRRPAKRKAISSISVVGTQAIFELEGKSTDDVKNLLFQKKIIESAREAFLLRLFESAAIKPFRSGQGSRVYLTCLEVSISQCDGCAAELLPLRCGYHNLVRRHQRRKPACGGGRWPGLRLVEPLLQVGHPRLRPYGDGAGPVTTGTSPLTARLVPVRTQSRFEVAMTQGSREQFLKDITSAPERSINKMLATIDVTKSECFKAEDRERIFEIVRKEVGATP
jgi:hypothetical protein